MTSVPLFPLPGCVLFPGIVLPLHVFEDRYRAMTRAVLGEPQSEQLIATALLKRDFEPAYHTDSAPIHGTVCVARVIGHERLPDGRFNLVLLGFARARIADEDRSDQFRRATLVPVDDIEDMDEDENTRVIEAVRALQAECHFEPFGTRSALDAFLAEGNDLATMIDLIAYHVMSPMDCELKQRVLSEPAVSVRARILLRYLRSAADSIRNANDRPNTWPPMVSTN